MAAPTGTPVAMELMAEGQHPDKMMCMQSGEGFPSILSLVLPMCDNQDLQKVGLVDRECSSMCEEEWRQRVISQFGALRFTTTHWRKVFKLRSYFLRRVVDNVSARVYLMNTRGDTTCFTMNKGKSMMCSRERAIVYNRCERMFDLSLRINRSIQEISALIGMVSVDEARGLLDEHINLLASVASLRSSLMFESELFQVFPAPVLLDANSLLRGTFNFTDENFLQNTTVMMQMWASIDGIIYRPLAPPSIVHALGEDELALRPGDNAQAEDAPAHAQQPAVTPTPSRIPSYKALKLHELSGMTIRIDDNTLRYRLLQQEMCVNALVSNSYLLYLFNPLQFRPMDWTYEAVLYVGETRCPLPMQREGVFLNSNTQAMRVFLSYGRMPDRSGSSDNEDEDEAGERRERGIRGSEDSDPLEIPYDGDTEVFSLLVLATNRVTRQTREVANKATCFTLRPTAPSSAQVAPALPSAFDNQAADSSGEMPPNEVKEASTQATTSSATQERHVHLPYDAMICYCFSEDYSLQYVEFAIGIEALLHRLGVSDFLPLESAAATR